LFQAIRADRSCAADGPQERMSPKGEQNVCSTPRPKRHEGTISGLCMSAGLDFQCLPCCGVTSAAISMHELENPAFVRSSRSLLSHSVIALTLTAPEYRLSPQTLYRAIESSGFGGHGVGAGVEAAW
jgi:hypothetical protein